MTRDEAIKAADECWKPNMSSAEHCVAMFEALGMLKLDEPKSLQTIIFDEFNSALGTMHYYRMKETLERLNLKIVEK